MSVVGQEVDALRTALGKMNIQSPVTVLLAPDDYIALNIRAKMDVDQWKYASFYGDSFNWAGIEFQIKR